MRQSLLDTSIEAAAEALQLNPDAPIPLGLPADVQERLELALASIRHVDGPSGIGQRDEAAALLRTQGSELVSTMVQSLLKEVNPRAWSSRGWRRQRVLMEHRSCAQS